MLLKINHHAQHNSGLYGTLREHEWMPRSQPGFINLWMGGNTKECLKGIDSFLFIMPSADVFLHSCTVITHVMGQDERQMPPLTTVYLKGTKTKLLFSGLGTHGILPV